MNVEALEKIKVVYSDRENETDADVHDAVSAVLSGECTSPTVIAKAEALARVLEQKGNQEAIELAEARLAISWAAYEYRGIS